jgi:predicted amidohydrolase
MISMKLRILICPLLLLVSCSKQTSMIDISQVEPRIPQIEFQLEGKAKKGFFIGMEPFLLQKDYRSEESFYRILKAYFDYAKKEEVIATERTVVILPEYLGTWLVASGEDSTLFDKKTIAEAMQEVALSHLGRFLWIYFFEKSYASDKMKETLFRMKALQMADSYQNVFSRLATEYRVDIVAGSIVLPEPKVIEGKITITDGPLQNVSFYFHSDGTVDAKITRKQFLIDEEKNFLSNQLKISNPVFKTPLGLLYIMICADSWYPEAYKDAKENSAEIIAIPSLVAPAESWNLKWNGYNGEQAPIDVNHQDVLKISEWQAWKKYSLLGRSKKININTGMNVFFNGNIWDLNPSGSAFLLRNGKQVSVKRNKEKSLGVIYALGI